MRTVGQLRFSMPAGTVSAASDESAIAGLVPHIASGEVQVVVRESALAQQVE
jgi:hypothetical protein